MQLYRFKSIIVLIVIIGFLSSCSTLERASLHGLNEGFYQLKSDSAEKQTIYLAVSEHHIQVYPTNHKQPESNPMLTIPLGMTGIIPFRRITLKKQGLDIDVSTVLMKYRPAIEELPSQLTTDLNLALYAGWRYDYFSVKNYSDPLGITKVKIQDRGFDFGVFIGPGTALVSPFTTRNRSTYEYNGMIVQGGFSVFIETHMASFGLAIGYDYLLSKDRAIWIYHNKPWVGFMMGIALN